jgi:hypothetical protein
VLSTYAMMRGARIALVVVVILSIAYVLITPDPTDDVDGILQQHHSAKAQRVVSLPLEESPILVVAPFYLPMRPSGAQRLITSDLLDLVCVCRC